MFKILKKYYLSYLIFISILFFLTSLVGESVNSLYEDLIFGQTLAIILAFFIGTIYFFWDTKWGPKKRKKLLSKSPFLEFKKLGFKEINDEIIGFYNNYQVKISYEWMGFDSKPCIQANIYFKQEKENTFISLDEQIELYKSLNISNNIVIDCLTKQWSFNLRPTKFKVIETFIESATKILIEKRLKPITLEESKNKFIKYKKFS